MNSPQRFDLRHPGAALTDRPAWLWLLIGFALLPFTAWQTVIPLAAWLAPIFLLRFARTARRARVALPLIFVAYAAGLLIAAHGGEAGESLLLLVLGAIQLPLIKALMSTLPYAADRLLGPRLGAWPRVLVFPLAYTTVDWLMSLLKRVSSMGSPAYSQYDNLALIQILSITGMWGLTFLIMWCASTVNALWEQGFNWRPVRGMVGVFVVVLLAVVLYGSARLGFFAPSSPTIEAATITLDNSVHQQSISGIDWGTFNQSTDAERAAARPQFEATVNQMLARTETALRGGAKLIAWQEGAATVLAEDKQGTLDRIAALARQYDAYLQVSVAVVERSTTLLFIQNQSILIDGTGNVRWTYNKTYPTFPVEGSYTIAGDGKLPVADTPYGRLSTAICNDFHFSPLIRQAGENDVDILVAPYNSVPPFESEDAATATYRAIENGSSLVRPAGHGISTMTDYEGRILARQNYFADSSGIMLTTVPTHGVTTIYSRIGDLFAYLCVAGLIALTGWAFTRRGRPAAVAADNTCTFRLIFAHPAQILGLSPVFSTFVPFSAHIGTFSLIRPTSLGLYCTAMNAATARMVACWSATPHHGQRVGVVARVLPARIHRGPGSRSVNFAVAGDSGPAVPLARRTGRLSESQTRVRQKGGKA